MKEKQRGRPKKKPQPEQFRRVVKEVSSTKLELDDISVETSRLNIDQADPSELEPPNDESQIDSLELFRKQELTITTMKQLCVVYDCTKTRKDGVALHRFPDDNRTKQAWIEFVRIQIPDWEGPTEVSAICSNHFTEDNYNPNYILKEEAGQPCRRKLKVGAIPTLFKKEDEEIMDTTIFDFDSRSCSPILDDSVQAGDSGDSTSVANAEDSDHGMPLDDEDDGAELDDISVETSRLNIDQADPSELEPPNDESQIDSLELFRKQLAEFPESPSRRKEPIILNICDLNNYITCALCGGYLYEASTITECMHTFCKTCIVRHAEKNLTCPTCDTIIHPTDPYVHIRHDSTIQDIVYRLLPAVAEEEQRREKEFYEEHERLTGDYIAPKLQLPPPPPKTPPPRPAIPIMPQRMKKKRKGFTNFNSQFVSLSLEFNGEFEGYMDDALEVDLEKKFVRVTGRATFGNVANFVKKKLRLDGIYAIDLLHTLEGEDLVMDEENTLATMRDEFYGGEDNIMELQYRIRAT